jgi:hypothetical protein
MKDIEYQRQLEAEQRKEERLLEAEARRTDRQIEAEGRREDAAFQRQVNAKRLEVAAQEARDLRDANIYAEAEKKAPAIGEARRFEKFKADIGPTDLSEDQLREVFERQYNQKRVGAFEGADRYVERYSKQKEDVLNQIRALGGSSSAIKEARESYKATSEAEMRADKEQLDRDRLEAQMNYQTGMVAAAMKRAGAAEVSAEASKTRAESPGATVRGQEYRTAADFTSRERTLRTQIGKAFGEEKTRLQGELDELLEARKTWEAGRSTAATSSAPAARPATPGSASTTSKNYSNLWK